MGITSKATNDRLPMIAWECLALSLFGYALDVAHLLHA